MKNICRDLSCYITDMEKIIFNKGEKKDLEKTEKQKWKQQTLESYWIQN